jgi:predicted ArsR family transcriptional regulator
METRIQLAVTESKLLELIRIFGDYQQDVAGLSAKELCQASGLSKDAMDRILNQLITEGLVECKQGRRMYRDGRKGFVPVYNATEKGVAHASAGDAAES